MILPKLDEPIKASRGIMLCRYFGMDDYAARVQANPGGYKTFYFNGCTGLPDGFFMSIHFLNLDWETITSRCALPHDLAYEYGIKGDKVGRYLADLRLRDDLMIKAGVGEWLSDVFFDTVRTFGKGCYGQ